MELDKLDCELLNLLQQDNRQSFAELARQLDISDYEVRKRYDKLLDENIFYPRIQLRLRQMGFDQIFNVRIELDNFDKDKYEEFLRGLRDNPFVSEIFSTSGKWDVMIVIVSINGPHYESIKQTIREDFSDIIGTWEETLTPRTYKFEEFDAEALKEALETHGE